MRIETWEIMQNADLDEIELQLAFQCAPLITGLKVSNLFQIDSRHYKRLCEILDKSNFSFCGLGGRNGSVSLLIYQKEWLEQFLQQEEVRILMHRLGYRDLHLERVLTKFRSRYIRYMQKNSSSRTRWEYCSDIRRRMWKALLYTKERTLCVRGIGKCMQNRKRSFGCLHNMIKQESGFWIYCIVALGWRIL